MDVGVSIHPWVFSPRFTEREAEMTFLYTAGFRVLRFPLTFHPSWFPPSEQNITHIYKLVDDWTSLGGKIIFTLFNISPILSAFSGSEDIGETAKWMFSPYGRGDVKILEALYQEREFMKDRVFTAIRKEAKENVFIDIFNGAETYQFTPYRVLRHYEPFYRYIENKTEDFIGTLGIKSLSSIGRIRRHIYIGSDQKLFYDTYHIYDSFKNVTYPYKECITEIGVSFLDKEGIPLDSLVMVKLWNMALSRLTKDSVLVCIHSPIDGRFRHLTYDKESCSDLWVADKYEKFLKENGSNFPHYDSFLYLLERNPSLCKLFDKKLSLKTFEVIWDKSPYDFVSL
jgi:hypothetical protein